MTNHKESKIVLSLTIQNEPEWTSKNLNDVAFKWDDFLRWFLFKKLLLNLKVALVFGMLDKCVT